MAEKEKPVTTDKKPVYNWQTEGLKKDAGKKRPLLIALLVIAAAVAVIWALGAFDKPKPETPQEKAPEAASVKLSEKIPARFAVDFADGDKYALSRDGGVEGMAYFSLDKDAVDAIFRRSGGIEGEVIEADGGELFGERGLETPWLKLTLDDTVIKIGDAIPTQSAYYAAREGDGALYSLARATVSALARPLNSLHTLPSDIGLSDEAVERLYISPREGETLEFARADARDSAFVASFFMLKPYRYPAHAQRMSDELLPAIAKIAPCAYKAHADSPDGEAEYGLNDPWLTISLSHTDGKTAEIRVGGQEDDCRYISFDDSGDVYLAKAELFSFMSDARSEYLADQFLHLIRIDSVLSLHITTHGKTREFDISTNAKGEREFKYDGQALKTEEGRALYERIISLKHDAACPDTAFEATPALSLTFRLTDGSEYSACYMPWDGDYYAVRAAGETRFMIRKSALDELLAHIA